MALGVISSLALAGCSSAPDKPGEANQDTGDFLACMVSDQGGFDDKSFNESGYLGLQQAEEELGVKINAVESKNENDYGPNLDNMVAQNCDITFTVGFMLADATRQAGEANPDSYFAIIDDNSIDDLNNVKSLVFRTSEAAFLAGYAAAAFTTSGIVATYGGMQFPSVTIFMDGFVDGVAQYNLDKGGSVQVLGWDKASQTGSFIGSFDDAAKGQTTTKTFIDQGADVILPVAGPVGAGTLAAARDAGNVAVIWVDADGFVTNPDFGDLILTSVIKEIGASVFTTISEVTKGSFDNAAYIGTLDNGGVSIAPFHDFDSQVSSETKAEIEALKQKIISGELVIESENNP